MWTNETQQNNSQEHVQASKQNRSIVGVNWNLNTLSSLVWTVVLFLSHECVNFSVEDIKFLNTEMFHMKNRIFREVFTTFLEVE